jgi:hypothetical protein
LLYVYTTFLYKMNENWQEKRIKGLIDELKTENQKSEALEEKLEQYHKKLQQEKEEIKQEKESLIKEKKENRQTKEHIQSKSSVKASTKPTQTKVKKEHRIAIIVTESDMIFLKSEQQKQKFYSFSSFIRHRIFG